MVYVALGRLKNSYGRNYSLTLTAKTMWNETKRHNVHENSQAWAVITKSQLCCSVSYNNESIFSFFLGSCWQLLVLSIDWSLQSVAIYQSKAEAHILADKTSILTQTDGLICGNWGRTAKLIIMFAYINACFSAFCFFNDLSN